MNRSVRNVLNYYIIQFGCINLLNNLVTTKNFPAFTENKCRLFHQQQQRHIVINQYVLCLETSPQSFIKLKLFVDQASL